MQRLTNTLARFAVLTATVLAFAVVTYAQGTYGSNTPGQSNGESQSSAAILTTAQSGEYGTYVANREGRAVYMFTADTSGQAGAASSSCYGKCAQVWPPVLANGNASVGSDLNSSLLGTTRRKDGSMQVTYGGWPLYYYEKDSGSGSVSGQDVREFGGEWYLVKPDGSKLEKER